MGQTLRRGVPVCRGWPTPSLRLSLLLAIALQSLPDLTGQEVSGGLERPRRLQADSIVFIYPPHQARAAEALASELESQPPLPGLPLDVLADARVTVILAADPASFDSLAPDAPDWAGGLAFPQSDRIVLPTFGPRAGGLPLATVLRHEVAHVAVGRYLGRSAPRWFHEGYAQLASGSWRASDAWALRLAILAGRVSSLDSLSLDFRRSRLSADLAYMLAYTAVDRLYRLGGDAGFSRLLERWREMRSLDTALRHTYGITLDQFERLWRRDVRGQYGWLLLVTQTTVFWSILAILLVTLGYWNKQRNRRKLAALEARVIQAQELSEGGWDEGSESEPRGAQDN